MIIMGQHYLNNFGGKSQEKNSYLVRQKCVGSEGLNTTIFYHDYVITISSTHLEIKVIANIDPLLSKRKLIPKTDKS